MLQQKYQDALDVLNGDLGQALDENTSFLNYVNTKKLEYLKKLGKWEQVIQFADILALFRISSKGRLPKSSGRQQF